jgi:hypothetical protein
MVQTTISDAFSNEPVFDFQLHLDDNLLIKMRRTLALSAWLRGSPDQQVQAIAGDEIQDLFRSPDDLPTGRPDEAFGEVPEDQADARSEDDLLANEFREVFLTAFRTECAWRLGLDLEFVGVEVRRGSVYVSGKARARPRSVYGKLKRAGVIISILNLILTGAAKYDDIKHNIPEMRQDVQMVVSDIQRVGDETLQKLVRIASERESSVRKALQIAGKIASEREVSMSEKLRKFFVQATEIPQEKRVPASFRCNLSEEASSAIQKLEHEKRALDAIGAATAPQSALDALDVAAAPQKPATQTLSNQSSSKTC